MEGRDHILGDELNGERCRDDVGSKLDQEIQSDTCLRVDGTGEGNLDHLPGRDVVIPGKRDDFTFSRPVIVIRTLRLILVLLLFLLRFLFRRLLGLFPAEICCDRLTDHSFQGITEDVVGDGHVELVILGSDDV